ncbi:MAG: hypothetical protein IPO12_06230 [Flavobacteriales bacterium]|nr:hypothetical protein [Flavobacteriales bacterium]
MHTEALDALDHGRVIAAGLDVLEFERPDLSNSTRSWSPSCNNACSRMNGCSHPHLAGVTHEGATRWPPCSRRKILSAFLR